MAKLKVVAGDLAQGDYTFHTYPTIHLETYHSISFGTLNRDHIPMDKGSVKSIEVLDEEKRRKLSSMMGWGFLGAITLGPLGALGGLLFSNKREITFACELNDGRKFMAVCPSKLWKEIQIAHF